MTGLRVIDSGGQALQRPNGLGPPACALPVNQRGVGDAASPGEGWKPFGLNRALDLNDGGFKNIHTSQHTKHRILLQAKYETPSLRSDVCCGTAYGMDLAERRRAHFIEWLDASKWNAKSLAEHVGVPYTTLHSYVKPNSVTRSLKGETEALIASQLGLTIEDLFGNPGAENHVQAWRESQHLLIDELADRIGADVSYVEGVEAGEIPLSPKVRARFAEGFGIPPGRLSYHPADIDREGAELFATVSPDDKPRLIEMMRVFKRTGTEG